jgi:hypothetical protein
LSGPSRFPRGMIQFLTGWTTMGNPATTKLTRR